MSYDTHFDVIIIGTGAGGGSAMAEATGLASGVEPPMGACHAPARAASRKHA